MTLNYSQCEVETPEEVKKITEKKGLFEWVIKYLTLHRSNKNIDLMKIGLGKKELDYSGSSKA